MAKYKERDDRRRNMRVLTALVNMSVGHKAAGDTVVFRPPGTMLYCWDELHSVIVENLRDRGYEVAVVEATERQPIRLRISGDGA